MDFITRRFAFSLYLSRLPCHRSALLRTPHTHFERGTPLRIILRDGQILYDRFEDHGSGHMRLRESGKLQLNRIKSVTVWKGKVDVKVAKP